MGTRNITSVILDGKQVVCQYGQWDGYPSYTGTIILEFLRDIDLPKFKKALQNTSITVSDYEDAVSYTGSMKDYSAFCNIVNAAKRALSDANDQWPTIIEVFDYLLQQGDLSEDELENYFVWSRDTGCGILPLIYNRSLDKPPLELAAMTHEYNGDFAWDIQGVYVLNLDDNTIKMTFDGYSYEFDLRNLPGEIEKTMLVFEEATRVLYEYQQQDSNFLQHAQEKGISVGSAGLCDLAADVLSKSFEFLEKDSPEVFANSESLNIMQPFVFDLLRRNSEKACPALLSTIQIAEEKVAAADSTSIQKNTQNPER